MISEILFAIALLALAFNLVSINIKVRQLGSSANINFEAKSIILLTALSIIILFYK